ncbi:FAD-linked oxidoreductase hmp9 [Paramyrothecium foliicola]|nr:FAD-linked oxidoreductase hmp9 [Paramyrothecium foliicola]
MLPRLANVLALSALVAFADAVAVPPSVRTRASSPRALHDIRRRLHEIRLSMRQDEVFSESISLEKSFTNATLLSETVELGDLIGGAPADGAQPPAGTPGDAPGNTPGDGQAGGGGETGVAVGIEVVCSRCYTKGTATAKLDIEGGVDPATLFDGALDAVGDSVAGTIDELTDWIGEIDFDFSDFELNIPAPDLDFNVDLSAFPDTVLEFSIDNLELLMEVETTLSGGITHEIPLFRSVGLGLELTPDLFLGLVFGVDLILSADAEISLTSGFHLALEDAAVLKVALFSEEATDLAFNGGRFEFLPVTVNSAQGTLRAILQLSLRAGFELSPPDLIPGFNLDIPFFDLGNLTASAGIETLVFANVADLVTRIEADFAPDAECALNIAQEYTLAVGAAAGATVALGDQVFGPTASTEIPIFTATIADLCAVDGPGATPTAALPPPPAGCNQTAPEATPAPVNPTPPALIVTTLTREVTHTAIQCRTTGLCQCPASMQTLKENVATETLVTSVPAGVVATFPETTGSVVSTTAAWGKGAQNFPASGPTAAPASHAKRSSATFHVMASNQEPVEFQLADESFPVNQGFMLVLSLGVGTPILLVMAGLIFVAKTKQHNVVVVTGGALSIGAIGVWVQGGGIGPSTHHWGIGSNQLVAAEVVLADGSVVTANACHHTEVYSALRGGGGSTYAVVLSATVKAHPNVPRAVKRTLSFPFTPANRSLGYAVFGFYSVANASLTGNGRVGYHHRGYVMNKTMEEAKTAIALIEAKLKALGLNFTLTWDANDDFAHSRLLDKEALESRPEQLRKVIYTSIGGPKGGAQNAIECMAAGQIWKDAADPHSSVHPAWRKTYCLHLVMRLVSGNADPEQIAAVKHDVSVVKGAAINALSPNTGNYTNYVTGGALPTLIGRTFTGPTTTAC